MTIMRSNLRLRLTLWYVVVLAAVAVLAYRNNKNHAATLAA